MEDVTKTFWCVFFGSQCRTLFYVNIHGSYKLLKTVRFFGPPCIFSGSSFNFHVAFAYRVDTYLKQAFTSILQQLCTTRQYKINNNNNNS